MNRRQKKQVISLVLLLVVGLVSFGQQRGWFGSTGTTVTKGVVSNQPGLYSISHYVDGDTIAVDMNGTTETIRMIGVDTPETHKPNTPVQCYGPAAAAYTKNRISTTGGKVRLVSDEKSTNRDRYDRLLRYVYLTDGTNLNLELVKNGYAFAYVSFPFTQSAEFSAAQEAAEADKKGLWGNCMPYQQDNGRWQSNNEV